jgi:hypothetical protein
MSANRVTDSSGADPIGDRASAGIARCRRPVATVPDRDLLQFGIDPSATLRAPPTATVTATARSRWTRGRTIIAPDGWTLGRREQLRKFCP